jgi:hypothetical protein
LAAGTEWTLNVGGTSIRYSHDRSELACFGKAGALAPVDGRLRFQILIDRTSIEVFANDEAFGMSGHFSPDERASCLEFAACDGAVKLVALDVHGFQSVWSWRNHSASCRSVFAPKPLNYQTTVPKQAFLRVKPGRPPATN